MAAKISAMLSAIVMFIMSLFGIGGYSMKTVLLKNVRYGDAERNVVDISFPKKAEGRTDLILMIHGGAWVAGDKDSYTDAIRDRAENGLVAAAMNYRYMSDAVHADDMLDDITAALGVIREEGEKRGISIEKVLLTGASAGAHLSLLYAYSRYEEAPIKPAAVVSYCGPADMASESAQQSFILHNELGDSNLMANLMTWLSGVTVTPDNYRSEAAVKALEHASPLYYVNKDTVPTVVCHGEVDTIVPYANAVALDKALTDNGVDHVFISYPSSGHGLDADPDCSAEAEKYTDIFIGKYLVRYEN